jgi:L,D-transpeptidase catalytic domain
MGRGAVRSGAFVSLVGGGVALILTACGGQEGSSAEAQDPQLQSGFLRPAAEGAGPEVLAAEKQNASDAPVAQETQVEAPPQPPAESARVEPEPRRTASETTGSAAELELAYAFLHGPRADFAGRVERASGLADERRSLWLALGAARVGELGRAGELGRGLESSEALTAAERSLLQVALEPSGTPSALAEASSLERSMELALVEREAETAAASGAHARAAAAWSRLILAEISSPWEADGAALERWSQALRIAQREHRWSPRGDWPSLDVKVRQGDSLIAIRKRVLEEHPDLLLCTGLIARANGLANEQAIRPDDMLRIPTERASVLVDLSSRWAFYLLGGEVAAAWSVGIGKEEGSTPVGTYAITLKQSEPMLFQPGRPPIPYGDPENPLGSRWLEWGQDGKGTHLGFHGTDDPTGIGGRVSKGCVRMRNEDVELLFEILPLGSKVTVQP